MFSKTDKEILLLIHEGNKRALIYLYRKNIRSVNRYVVSCGGTKDEAKELLKDALTVLWKEIVQFKHSPPENLSVFLMTEVKSGWAKIHSETEIRKFIEKRTTQRISLGKKIIFGVGICVFIVLAAWWVMDIQPEFPDISRTKRLFSLKDSTTKEEAKSEKGTGTKIKSSKSNSLAVEQNKDTLNGIQIPFEGDSIAMVTDTLQVTDLGEGGDENIVIRKDELLYSRIIQVIQTSVDPPENSLSAEAASKLNPEADLPELENEVPKSFLVEFWKSPVNYKGYMVGKGKIIFYGIDEPDWVKLYYLNNNLYLGYGNSYFILNYTPDYNSFVKVSNANITSLLKK